MKFCKDCKHSYWERMGVPVMYCKSPNLVEPVMGESFTVSCQGMRQQSDAPWTCGISGAWFEIRRDPKEIPNG